MNKKFLSAVLFGALLASTTGTFTSCKDYDDDINGLSERVDAIEKTLADLNTKFGSLAYVKSVSFAGGELVVTDQDGKPERFSIPDKNTTYSLEINQSTEGDATTVTIVLRMVMVKWFLLSHLLLLTRILLLKIQHWILPCSGWMKTV